MKYLVMIINLTFLLILTGCWDELPIDERGFVIGSAIDMAEEEEGGAGKTPSITLTNQFVIPSGMSNPGQGGGEGGPAAFHNLPTTGQSAYIISREMQSFIDWIINYDHLKIILVSKEVASEPGVFPSVLDSFIRNQQVRRGIRVLITEGKAKEVLGVKTETEDVPALFIETLLNNNMRSLELIEPVRIGTLHRFLLNNGSYVLPLVTVDGGNIHYDSVAVFDGRSDRQIGTLTGEDISGLNFIRGELTKGAVEFEVENELMIYEVHNTKTNIKINAENPDQLQITIDIHTEGSIGEMYGSKSLLHRSYFSEIEKKISEEIEKIVKETINIAQEDLKVDFLGLGREVREQHKKLWKKIEDDWEEGDQLFTQSNIDVSVKSIVRNIGASDKAKSRGER